MKPRIEKKLSKRICAILANHPRRLGAVWIDSEFERYVFLPYDRAPTAAEQRRRWECSVKVNHMPSLGGEADYWGEGSDYYSVYHLFRECAYWDQPKMSAWLNAENARMGTELDAKWSGKPVEPQPARPYPTTRRLTGRDVIRQVQQYALKPDHQY